MQPGQPDHIVFTCEAGQEGALLLSACVCVWGGCIKAKLQQLRRNGCLIEPRVRRAREKERKRKSERERKRDERDTEGGREGEEHKPEVLHTRDKS